MFGLVFGLEKNVCEYILIHTDSQGFFWWVCPWTAGGWGGGGMGLGIAPWTRAWVKNVFRPSKTQLIFWCIANNGKGKRLLGEGYERSMHTWRLVDVGVFFTFFFLTPFCSASFFSFLGTLRKKNLPNCPIASTVRSVQFFFFDLVRVFFKSFLGASVSLHS